MLPTRFAAALAFLAAMAAQAGSFSAVPVRLTLAAGSKSTSLLLENKGDEPVLVQAELMSWIQHEGDDVLSPSRDLVVSPPIFTILPGAAQTVRVGLLRPADPGRELTYRLFLQEVPPPQQPNRRGVSVALRLSLPVFVLPRGPAAPALAWRAAPKPEGAIRLTLANSGNSHVQAIDCRIYLPDGALIAAHNLSGYVLSGQTRSWQIKPSQPWRGERLKLVARTDIGDITAEIMPE